MRRRLLSIATVLSWLLLSLTLATGVRSCVSSDAYVDRVYQIEVIPGDQNQRILREQYHSIMIGRWGVGIRWTRVFAALSRRFANNYPPGTDAWSGWEHYGPVYPADNHDWDPKSPQVSTEPNPFANSLGFYWSSTPRYGRREGIELAFPLWPLILLTSFLPFCSIITRLRLWIAAHQPRPGFCRVCGYDLRATPERCPECGTTVKRA